MGLFIAWVGVNEFTWGDLEMNDVLDGDWLTDDEGVHEVTLLPGDLDDLDELEGDQLLELGERVYDLFESCFIGVTVAE